MSIGALTSDVAIGNAAGWALAFGHDEDDDSPLLLASSDYYAEIEAELPGDLGGGTYRFTIEGLIDDHYGRLTALGEEGTLGVVRLYLFWVDANASVAGYLQNLLGLTGLLGSLDQSALASSLVATLAITKVGRRLGARRYETIVEARELVYDRLSARTPAPLQASSFKQAITDIGTAANVSVTPYVDLQDPAGSAPGTESVSIAKGTTYAAAVEQIAKSVEQASGKAGRGMALVRDGALHFGTRPIPLEGGDAKPLTLRTGMIESELSGAVATDPNHDAGKGSPRVRRQFRLTLKGRPDIKPGDLVAFCAPEADVSTTLPGLAQAVAGSLAGDIVGEIDADTLDTTLYVTSVQHRLGRATGFATVLAGVEADDGDDAWDAPTPSGARNATADTGLVGARSSGAGELAQAVGAVARDAAIAQEPLEVGEVRATHTQGTKEPPSQTTTVIAGLAPPDGRAHGARRLDVDRQDARESAGVPYVTPFAWGHAGLVVPRYPGTRVALAFRHGESADPVEIGALWESGHGPDSDPGDWWLILPADTQNVSTADLSGTATATEPNDFPATNDLIDADGNRFIEVGRLTIRVGAKTLGNAGVRPEAGTDTEYVAIEHEDGKTKLVIDQDGTITLHAEKDLNISAAETINIKADTIAVDVGDGGMDVS